MTRTTTLRAVTAAAATALVLTACGGDSGDSTAEAADQLVISDDGAATQAAADEVVIVGDTATAAAEPAAGSPSAATPTAAAGSEEDQALAFAACMRAEGIDWPDPTFNADGSIDLLGDIGPGAGGRGGELFSDQDSIEGALDTCGPLIEGASFLPDRSQAFDAEAQDALLDFTQCLRDQGLEVDDPDLGGVGSGGFPGGGGGGLFGDGFDPSDPAVQPAIQACQSLFVGGPFGGGN